MKTYGDVLNLAIQKSKGKCDVFVDYQAHVEDITIRVYPKGWHNNPNWIGLKHMKKTKDTPTT